MSEANAFLVSSGLKSVKFPDGVYPHTDGGVVVREPEKRQQTDYDTDKPKFFDDGRPMFQVVVAVRTNSRDPQDPYDDGVRGFYLKGEMLKAVKAAVRASGAPGVHPGGVLMVTCVGEGPNSRGRGKPKKRYTATYTPPVPAGEQPPGSDGGKPVALSSTPPF